MNYQVIADEKILNDFIESLPELGKHEKFYVCLFARSKYLTEEQRGKLAHVKSDKAQLKRFLATKHNLKTKLRQLECPLGSYIQYKTNVPDNPIPQESLAVYMTINPRDLQKATRSSLKKFVDMVVSNPEDPFDPSNFAMSEIQRSRGKTNWVIFDIDSKIFNAEEMNSRINSLIGGGEFKILETRGGYHIMINPQSPNNKNWFQHVTNYFKELDQSGDMMIPIPGTYQGGFIPKFI